MCEELSQPPLSDCTRTSSVGIMENNIYVSGLIMYVSTVYRGFELAQSAGEPGRHVSGNSLFSHKISN